MTIVRTAAAYGAQVRDRTRVVGFLRGGRAGRRRRVRDVETGGEFEVRAQQVVNATGVWTDDTQAMVGERGQFQVRASKGIHLVVPRDRIHSTTGLILRTEKSVLFVIPWGRHWIVGTTDTDWDLDKAHPAATSADIDYLLEHVNSVLATPLTHDDVEGVYAGLRPLLAGERDATSKLSREHAVAQPVPGLVVVAGGKYTTYRVMAKDAVDAAVRRPGPAGSPPASPRTCRCSAPRATARCGTRGRGSAARTGLHVARVEHLLNRYGSLADELLALIDGRPGARRAAARRRRLSRGRGRLRGLARGRAAPRRRAGPPHPHLDRDVRPRRPAAPGRSPELMAPVLGWDDEQVEREVEHYGKRVEAERETQRQPDDETADAARLGAPDIVPVR